MKIKTTLTLLVLSAALGTMTTAAHAQTSASWTAGATGNWNTPGNWSGSTVPNGNFAAWFTNGVATLVDVSSAVSLSSVRATNSTAATLSGATLNFDQGGANNITSYLGSSLTISNGITFSGSTAPLNVNSGGTTTLNGAITSSGSRILRQLSSGTLLLNGDNSSMTGTATTNTWTDVTVSFENGTIVVGHDNALGTGRLLFNGGANNINLTATNRTIANGLVFGGTGAARLRTGRGSTVTFTSSDIVGTNGITITNTGGSSGVATIRFTGTSIDFTNAINIATSNDRLELGNASGSQSWSGTISGPGGLIKSGAGSATLSGNNTFTNETVVTGGTLRLNASIGSALGSSGALNVTNATVLISKSDQVNNGAAVSLSGGTIAKGAGAINETMGALTLSATSFLDFGSGTGNFTFASYSPSSFKLTFQNFNLGNSLTVTTGTFNTNNFNFNGFGYSFDTVPSGGFTITAIPEPSTVVVAGALAALLGGSALRRRRRRP